MQTFQLIEVLTDAIKANKATVKRSDDRLTFFITCQGMNVELRLRVSGRLQVELQVIVNETKWYSGPLGNNERDNMLELADAYKDSESDEYDDRRKLADKWIESILPPPVPFGFDAP